MHEEKCRLASALAKTVLARPAVCGAMIICCHGEICSEGATGRTGGKMESSYCMLNDAFMMYSAQANAKSPGVHPPPGHELYIKWSS